MSSSFRKAADVGVDRRKKDVGSILELIYCLHDKR